MALEADGQSPGVTSLRYIVMDVQQFRSTEYVWEACRSLHNVSAILF